MVEISPRNVKDIVLPASEKFTLKGPEDFNILLARERPVDLKDGFEMMRRMMVDLVRMKGESVKESEMRSFVAAVVRSFADGVYEGRIIENLGLAFEEDITGISDREFLFIPKDTGSKSKTDFLDYDKKKTACDFHSGEDLEKIASASLSDLRTSIRSLACEGIEGNYFQGVYSVASSALSAFGSGVSFETIMAKVSEAFSTPL